MRMLRTLMPILGIMVALPLLAQRPLQAQAQEQAQTAATDRLAGTSKFMSYFPQGKSCVRYRDAELNLMNKLEGNVKERLLTPDAIAAGVEVWSTSSDENKFGNVSLLYFQPKGDCVLWYETVSVVEYCTRLGLTPYGVSPFYKDDK